PRARLLHSETGTPARKSAHAPTAGRIRPRRRHRRQAARRVTTPRPGSREAHAFLRAGSRVVSTFLRRRHRERPVRGYCSVKLMSIMVFTSTGSPLSKVGL